MGGITMQNKYYMGEINKAKKLISLSLGNLTEIIEILKSLAMCDRVDLLFYDSGKSHFYDKVNKNTISLAHLKKETKSIIGKVYLSKSPHKSYLRFDSYYNVSIDNPYKLDITSQIVFPIIREDIVIGIVRLSKFKYIFENSFIKVLEELIGVLNDIFSFEINNKDKDRYQTLFGINQNDVDASLHTVKNEITKLISATNDPEIKKLISNIEDNLHSINKYIQINQQQTIIQPKPFKDAISVLIADDVRMNVKILSAMIKNTENINIDFAYDGIEALEKIENANKDEQGIEVLFLDHYMPGKLGLEVAKDIRKNESQSNTKRIVIVSITNDPSAITEHKNLYDYQVSKPFVSKDLDTVMRKIIKQYS